jgi:hypothetical protein
LDGEVVAVDQAGRPSFQALQHLGKRTGFHLVFFAFDALNFEGVDWKRRPVGRTPRAEGAPFGCAESFTRYSRKNLGIFGRVEPQPRPGAELTDRTLEVPKGIALLTRVTVVAASSPSAGAGPHARPRQETVVSNDSRSAWSRWTKSASLLE